jgi:putative membrane protein
MKKLIGLVAAIAVTAALALPVASGAAGGNGTMAGGNEGTAGGNGGSQRASAQDMKFVREATMIDLYEIKGGEAAMKQGTDSSVTKLGEDLSRDHSSSYKEAEEVAKATGAAVAKAPSAKMKTELAKVGAMKGTAFDKAFATAQIVGHKEAIAKAKTELSKGSSKMVLALTKKDLKMYEMHLKESQAVLAEMGGTKAGE